MKLINMWKKKKKEPINLEKHIVEIVSKVSGLNYDFLFERKNIPLHTFGLDSLDNFEIIYNIEQSLNCQIPDSGFENVDDFTINKIIKIVNEYCEN